MITLIIMVVLGIAVTTVLIMFMTTVQRSVPKNYLLLLVQTVSLTYLAGYLAVKKSTDLVLAALIGTFCISIVMAFVAGKLLGKAEKKMAKIGKSTGILGMIVVIGLLLMLVVKDGESGNAVWLILGLFFVFGYMLLDTFAIINGKYSKIVSKEDYIYGSAKLFADFVLIFSLIMTLFGGEGE